MTQLARLEITDGTTTVDLIAGKRTGFHLLSWSPKIIGLKGGGVYQDSGIAPFRRLAFGVDETVSEAMTLRVNDYGQDALIGIIDDLLVLLQKARNYWLTDWQDTPVYLIAKGPRETGTRYGLIHNYNIGELENPYAAPFYNINEIAVLEQITLGIERDHWTGNAPGTGTAVAISGTQTYDGRTLGRVATATEEEVFVGNQHTQANLTDIYVDDGGVFGSNLLDAALPYSLLPATPVANDAIYFGIDTSLADSGPFTNLVFDTGTINLGGRLEFVWEYWNGSAWSVFTHRIMFDGTSNITFTPAPLDTDFFSWNISGVNLIQFFPVSSWTTTTVNGITGYWIRARVLVVTAGFTVPTQQNRNIYSCILPYANITSDQVEGTLSALARLQSELRVPQSQASAGNAGPQIDRTIIGLRSSERGANFTAYLNCADEQENSLYSVSLPGSLTTFASDITSPTGRKVNYNPTQIEEFATGIVIKPSSPTHFYGTYHVFVRAKQVGGDIGDINIKVASVLQSGASTTSYNEVITSTKAKPILQTQTNQFGPQWFLVDMGQLSFPSGNFRNQTALDDPGFAVLFNCTVSSSIPDVDIIDIIIIPIDEWTGDFSRIQSTLSIKNSGSSANQQALERIDANGIAPIAQYFFREEAESGNDIKGIPNVISNGVPILQANVQQRLWYILAQYVQVDGSHTGANNASTLTDSAADFINAGVTPGDIVVNTTDDSQATITAVTATTVTGTLVGGTDNDWDTNDNYYILTSNWGARGDLCASVFVQKQQRYLGMRGAS